MLNDDLGRVAGGLYIRIRHPWFGGNDYHEAMPNTYDEAEHATVIRVGDRTDRICHFWSLSPRAALPPGALEGMHGQSSRQDFSWRFAANWI